jgi:hypothetical protein
LGDSKFVEGSKISASGVVKPSKDMITRQVTSHGSQGGEKRAFDYLIIDNPTKLKPEDWERVVAVISIGKDWQFKGWKWSTPVELFSHVKRVICPLGTHTHAHSIS